MTQTKFGCQGTFSAAEEQNELHVLMEKEIDRQVANCLKRQHDEDIHAFEQLSISDDKDDSHCKKMDSDEEHHARRKGQSTVSCSVLTYNTLDDCIDDAVYSILSTLACHPSSKRQKVMHITFSRIQTSPGKPKPVTIKILIDTGASKTIVKYQHTHKLKHSKDYEEKQTHFETTAGTFSTHAKAKIQFSLNELFEKRLVEHVAHAAKDLSNYDMIIGRHLLHELGIDIKFSTKTIEWDGVSIPLRSIDATKEDSICQIEDPPFITAETE